MTDPIQPLDPQQEAEHEESASHEGYIHRVIEEADVLINVETGGLQDETISSRLARDAVDGHGVTQEVGKVGSTILDKFEPNHGAGAVAADLERAERIEEVEEDSGIVPKGVRPLDAITFNSITPEHFARIQAEVDREAGLELSGNSGEASVSGFTFLWNYNPESQDLTLQCTKKPWAIPAAMVQHKLQELVAETQNAS